MRIIIQFQFEDETTAAATTGVQGDVTDFLLPCSGDIVRHCYEDGRPFVGQVIARTLSYDVPSGIGVPGLIMVTALLRKIELSRLVDPPQPDTLPVF